MLIGKSISRHGADMARKAKDFMKFWKEGNILSY